MSASGVICVFSNIVVTKIFFSGFSVGFVSVSEPLTHLKCNSPTARNNLFCHFPLCVKQNCAQISQAQARPGEWREGGCISCHWPSSLTRTQAWHVTGASDSEDILLEIWNNVEDWSRDRAEIVASQAADWPSVPWSLVLGWNNKSWYPPTLNWDKIYQVWVATGYTRQSIVKFVKRKALCVLNETLMLYVNEPGMGENRATKLSIFSLMPRSWNDVKYPRKDIFLDRKQG